MRDLPTCPETWHEDLDRTLDFEGAYRALEGYEHFHTYTLRARLRFFQFRIDEAIRLLAEAERLYLDFEPSEDNLRRRFLIPYQLFEVRLFQESQIKNSETQARTDEALKSARSLAQTGGEFVKLSFFKADGALHLLRGNFQEALEIFSEFLATGGSTHAEALYPYAGAAAAAFELGLLKEARRNYENLELCMSFTSSRMMFYLLTCWLRALTAHWGWENESSRWTETMRVMECSAEARELLERRYQILRSNIQSGVTIPAL